VQFLCKQGTLIIKDLRERLFFADTGAKGDTGDPGFKGDIGPVGMYHTTHAAFV